VKPYDPVTLSAAVLWSSPEPSARGRCSIGSRRLCGSTTHHVHLLDFLERVQGDAILAELEKALRSLSGRAKS
jgi:hypothetical protein